MFSKSEFMQANTDKKLTEIDYLHAVFKFEDIHTDIVKSFSVLFNPSLVEIDGLLYLEEIYNTEKYKSYISDGLEYYKIQYWMNLIEITSIFENISFSKASEFADSIAETWNHKLLLINPNTEESAQVMRDQDNNEVFITLCRLSEL